MRYQIAAVTRLMFLLGELLLEGRPPNDSFVTGKLNWRSPRGHLGHLSLEGEQCR